MTLPHHPDDVPVTLDFRQNEPARTWSAAAMQLRPWREDFFVAFAQEIARFAAGRPLRILELGSGPGFLAQRLLALYEGHTYTAVDFSPTMHTLARERLGRAADRVQFVERNLRDPQWHAGLGPFDAVVTHQAVHELRHKRHAPVLHAQVRSLLAPHGRYWVCDHYVGDDGMANADLYMTVDEQRAALGDAGF